MPSYLQGILAAFLEPVLHGGVNIVDHFLSSKVFPRLTTLVLFETALAVVFTSMVVCWFDPPHLLSLPLLLIAFIVAAIEVCYLFPYYYSLREADTSIVAALFSLGKIFVPILAFFLLGERLAVIQYVGFFLIIASSVALNFDIRKLRLNPAFFLMLFVSVILAVETILYKYAFTHGASWSSFIFPMVIFECLIAAFLFVVTGAFRTLSADFVKVRSAGWLFLLNEIAGWGGNMGDSFALSILPVTVARAIGSTQSLFVLLYAYLFKNKRPELFREQIGKSDLLKKGSFFTLIIIGVVLVVTFGSTGE